LKRTDSNLGAFLDASGWGGAKCDQLTGDASTRRYFRLSTDHRSAILMDASRAADSVAPFVRIGGHLSQLGFSAPEILSRDEPAGLLLLEDFGDCNFAQLLDDASFGHDSEELYALATDVLIALHKTPQTVHEHLRSYSSDQMLADLELFLEWRTPHLAPTDREEFRAAWRAVLPLAHRVPESLLLRDYHPANLMLLPGRDGVRRAGLLDFQDAYRGPVTYDLVSLLEDARRDVPESLRARMLARYAAQFPGMDAGIFEASLAVVAALRHTRVLAIFDRLACRDGRGEYRRLHSPRVERLLRHAFRHSALEPVKRWMDRHAS
jgi:aminoglycoside/choline kinase family phosphotransferase